MRNFEAARVAMVDRQVRTADVTRLSIIDAMLAIPRERFVPRAMRDVAYADAQIELAPGRTLLEPRTFAKMLEAAALDRDDLALDVGCGMGYSAMVASRLCGAVVALEEDETLAAAAEAAAVDLEAHNVLVERGPLAAGAPGSGPYDVILLQGGAAAVPAALLDQLKDGGRLVGVIVDGAVGQARVFTRAGGVVSSRRIFDATAPLLPGFDAAAAFSF